jgi:hypothetical protein
MIRPTLPAGVASSHKKTPVNHATNQRFRWNDAVLLRVFIIHITPKNIFSRLRSGPQNIGKTRNFFVCSTS